MGADGEKLYDGTGLEKHLDECQKVLLSVSVNLQTHTGHSKTSGHEFCITGSDVDAPFFHVFVHLCLRLVHCLVLIISMVNKIQN